jgi:hypothetical protein
MSEGAAEEEGGPYHQEDKSAPGMYSDSPPCVAEEAHGIEPHQETDNSDSGVPDEFSHNVGKDESGPVVCAAFAFPMQGSKLVADG